MKTIHIILFILLLLSDSFTTQIAAAQGAKRPREPLTRNAVEAILETFDKYQIVALSEAHRLQEEHDFITSLIQHAAFPTKVNDIVIEWGNALYQNIIDRFISGEDVPIAELRQVWRDTGFSSWTWDAPVYEQFFITVRAVNQKLPPSKRLRVLAGDPPLDWAKSKEEIVAIQQQYPRDKHFAAIVEKVIFANGRKALLIMGMGHLLRHSWNPYSDQQPETVIDILDQRHPKATFVVMVHAFPNRNAEMEARFASWPKPSFVLLNNTWLGAMETDLVLTQSVTRGFPDGKVVTVKVNPYAGLKLEDLADAYLYFGDLDSLTASFPSPEMYRADQAYLRQLQRRFEMMSGGRRFPVESLLQERQSKKYYNVPKTAPPPRR